MCGWKNVLKYMWYCLKTENMCLGYSTKQSLIFSDLPPLHWDYVSQRLMS